MFLRKIAAPSGSYSVSKSLRFRSSASAYLNRTPASASNRTTWTWSGWVKRGALTVGSGCNIFLAQSGTTYTYISFNSSDQINVGSATSGTTNHDQVTAAVFRDPSAWYHIVLAFDTTQATASNRVKLWVNGNLQTVTINTQIAQNTNGAVNNTVFHSHGSNATPASFLDGYLAEVNFIDGSALTPSSFGAYDTNGVWQPIKYSGSFGTNGFDLSFGNTTSTTTLGYDTSGNSNNWTTNNISLTAGSTYDSMTDSPTVSSATVTNYPVLNPIDKSSSLTLTNGNLQSSVATTWQNIRATFGITSGTWYWEYTMTATGLTMIGIGTSSVPLTGGAYLNAGFYGYYSYDGSKWNNNVNASYGSSFTTNDVISVAFDASNGKIWFAKNGIYQASGVPTSGTNPAYSGLTATPYFPMVSQDNSQGTNGGAINFGQQPFVYTPPTGFNALNTYNLPTPTIANGAQYMAATTYTGTGNANGDTLAVLNSNNTTINTTFQPDLVWAKLRSGSGASSTNLQNILADSLRGTSNLINSDSTAAEYSGGGITAFNSNGFTAQRNTTYNQNNVNTWTYVGWQWKGGGTGVSNTAGSLTSTVSANTTAGFSVVTWTEPASGANTVGHGLGVAPSLIIVKARAASTNWPTWHTSIGAANILRLNLGNASAADTGFNSTAPTSTVFSTNFGFNSTSVAYCWAAVSGYSAFGSYTGNGSTDGPFVYTGFRPRFLLVKRTDTVESWNIVDTSRDTYNQAGTNLYPNLANAESTNNLCDLLSNGFKLRNTWTGANTSGGTYIYAAFAENPFNSSRAR